MKPRSPLGLGKPPWIAAHRGASADAPENTLAALHLAFAQGADLAEVDIQLTADGALVLAHDRDLSRVAGADLVVERSRRVDLAAAYPALPDLAQVLAALPSGFPLNLELKRYDAPRRRMVEALCHTLRGRRRRVLISSFDHVLLDAVRGELPAAELAPIASRDASPLLFAGQRLAAASLHVHRRLVTSELAATARFVGRPLLAYTVDDAAEARRLLELGVSGLFTNRPAELRQALALPVGASA